MKKLNNALVVEDLPAPRQTFSEVLMATFPGIEVRLAPDLASAYRAVADSAPDIALVDLGLPDGNGADLIRALRQDQPACQCVVTTIYADDQHVFPALRAGAAGYLLKDQSPARMVSQLQGICNGEPPLSPVIARRLLKIFEPEPADAGAVQLSPREKETLILIAKGYRLNEVAESMGLTRNTAAGYIKSVYRKLEVSSRAEAALAASRLGLINRDL